MKWFSYSWFFLTAATLEGFMALGFFIMWIALRWQRHELQGLSEERAERKAQIVQIEGTVAEPKKTRKTADSTSTGSEGSCASEPGPS